MKKYSFESKVTLGNILIKHFNSFSLCLPPSFLLLAAAKRAQAILGKILWHKFLISKIFMLLTAVYFPMNIKSVEYAQAQPRQIHSALLCPKFSLHFSVNSEIDTRLPPRKLKLSQHPHLNQNKETVGCILQTLYRSHSISIYLSDSRITPLKEDA